MDYLLKTISAQLRVIKEKPGPAMLQYFGCRKPINLRDENEPDLMATLNGSGSPEGAGFLRVAARKDGPNSSRSKAERQEAWR